MWAVVEYRPGIIDTVLIEGTYGQAVERAVMLAGERGWLDTEDEDSVEKHINTLTTLGDLVRGETRIAVKRAFHG